MGISYFAFNTLSKEFFAGYYNSRKEDYQELAVYNSAFSFQLTPVYAVGLNDEGETRLRLAGGIQYRKLYTDADYMLFKKEPPGDAVLKNTYSQKATGGFKLNFIPSAGIIFTLNKNLMLGFDIPGNR